MSVNIYAYFVIGVPASSLVTFGAGTHTVTKYNEDTGEPYEKEVDEKMRKERIEQEIREQKETAQRQMEKDRLRREAMGQQPSDLKASLRAADVKTEQRRTDDIVRKQQEQRQQRQEAKMNQGGWSGGSAKAPEIPKQKIDPATLQHARESAVKGEE